MGFTLADGVTLAATDYGTVLLDGRRGSYWQLNETGSQIASALLAGSTPEDVAAGLRAGFSVELERARADVDDLVRDLVGAGLMREAAR